MLESIEAYFEEYVIRYTQKQVDKFNRQKAITELEKISKNLFRMLRDDSVELEAFVEKFRRLKERYDNRVEIELDSEYHQALKAYILRLYQETCHNEAFTQEKLDDIREAEMSNLNRLQKLKNENTYKKAKHKHRDKNQDWGVNEI